MAGRRLYKLIREKGDPVIGDTLPESFKTRKGEDMVYRCPYCKSFSEGSAPFKGAVEDKALCPVCRKFFDKKKAILSVRDKAVFLAIKLGLLRSSYRPLT
jgi:hypothetical protein